MLWGDVLRIYHTEHWIKDCACEVVDHDSNVELCTVLIDPQLVKLCIGIDGDKTHLKPYIGPG
jgi:hypothetical protein